MLLTRLKTLSLRIYADSIIVSPAAVRYGRTRFSSLVRQNGSGKIEELILRTQISAPQRVRLRFFSYFAIKKIHLMFHSARARFGIFSSSMNALGSGISWFRRLTTQTST